MSRQTLQPKQLFSSKEWGFSQVVISEPGRIVHISGQVAWDANQQCNIKDLKGQFRQALQNVFIALETAGGTSDDLQTLRLYIIDFKPGRDADVIAEVLLDTFGSENPPASSWIGVHALAQPEYLIEVEATAVIPV